LVVSSKQITDKPNSYRTIIKQSIKQPSKHQTPNTKHNKTAQTTKQTNDKQTKQTNKQTIVKPVQ
jgi:hypothetical protein